MRITSPPLTSAAQLTALVTADGASGGFVKDADRAADAEAQAQASTVKVVTAANMAARPCFSANKNATAQTGIASVTFTKLTFTTEEFDNGSYYDAVNSKWTPPIGKCRISATALTTHTSTGSNQLAIYKNGVVAKAGLNANTALANTGVSVSGVFDCSGTDYFELYLYATSATTAAVNGGIDNTHFEGEMV